MDISVKFVQWYKALVTTPGFLMCPVHMLLIETVQRRCLCAPGSPYGGTETGSSIVKIYFYFYMLTWDVTILALTFFTVQCCA